MNLLSLFTTADPQSVVDSHNAYYPSEPTTIEIYRDIFLANIRQKILVSSQGKIIIDHHVKHYADNKNNEDTVEIFYAESNDPTLHSPSFLSWSVMLGCEVVCRVDIPFTLVDQAAHIFYEMTWHGLEEEHAIERRDQVTDLVESVTDRPKRTVTEQSPRSVFHDLFPYESDDSIKEMIQTTHHRYGTMKFYINGVLQDQPPKSGKALLDM